MLASIWIPPFVKSSCCIVAHTAWSVILAKLRSKNFDCENLPNARLHTLEDDLQIAFLELLAFMLTILEMVRLAKQFHRIAKLIFRKVLIFKCDNQNVCSWVSKGRCPFFPFSRCLKYLLAFEIKNEAKIIMDWVPSEKMLADSLTRGKSYVVASMSSTNSTSSKKHSSKSPTKQVSRSLKAKQHSSETIKDLVTILTEGLPPS